MYHEARIEELWQEYRHQPKMQALMVAVHCITHAPELAQPLIERIAAATPPEIKGARVNPFETKVDERLVAIGLLVACMRRGSQNRPLKQLPLLEADDTKTLKIPLHEICERVLKSTDTKTHPKKDPQNAIIRVDWELGRLSIALNLSAPFRLWILAREITRNDSGSGVINRHELWQMTRRHNLIYTRRHFNRLLQNGDGHFWKSTDDGHQLYLTSIQQIGRSFTALAAAAKIPLDYNMPGVRQVLLDVGGSHEQWEAMLYAGWIAGRSAKGRSQSGGEHVTIARATLSALFGRHENTLRRWENSRLSDIVTVRHNVAQYIPDDITAERPIIEHFPAHTRPYLANVRTFKGVIQEVRLYWQIANTYSADLPLSDHKGQAEKVRQASNSVCNPADKLSGGQVRLYYRDAKALKRRMRSRKLKMGLMGDPMRKVFVYLGMHRRSLRGVFEWTNRDFPITRPDERAHPTREGTFFAGAGRGELAHWESRQAYILATE